MDQHEIVDPRPSNAVLYSAVEYKFTFITPAIMPYPKIVDHLIGQINFIDGRRHVVGRGLNFMSFVYNRVGPCELMILENV